MTSTEQRIGRWLAALFEPGRLPGDEPITFSLLHASVDQTQRTLRTWRLGPEIPGAADTGQLVAEVDAEAGDDATEMGGMQRYFLRATIRGKEVGSIALRYNTEAGSGFHVESPGVDSEPASARGLLAQSQRHMEGLARLLVQSFGGIVDGHQKLIAVQQDMITLLSKEHLSVLAKEQEIAARNIDGEIALSEHQQKLELTAMKETSRQEQVNAAIAQIIKYAPSVLHHLTGGKLGDSPEEARRKAIIETITPMDEATFNAHLASHVAEEDREEVAALYHGIKRPDGPDTPEAPADDKASASEPPAVVRVAKALYEALLHKPPAALGPRALTGATWADLSDTDRGAVAALAAVAFRAGGVVEDHPRLGELLWSAVVERSSTLPAIGAMLARRAPFEALSSDERLSVLKLANAALAKLAVAATRESRARQDGAPDSAAQDLSGAPTEEGS